MTKKLWIAIASCVWLVALCGSRDRCAPAWFSYGIAVRSCPDGVVRQTARIDATGLQRGAAGRITLQALAHYTTHDADDEDQAAGPRMAAIQLSLIGAATGKSPGDRASWPLEAEAWSHAGAASVGKLTLPVVPDGDYQLHASYETRLGKGEVSLPLALYAPARIHVITDRPLYEPGNTVRFRAVVLRAHDLTPLDHRPGTWVIRDPDGEVLLEEAAPAGDWGVVAGSFPLDKAARTGAWKVAWRSADAVDEVAFTVEPFTLPRFRVDAVADRPFYQPGDRPRIKGAVLYSSGAPVAAAQLEVSWDVSSAWPPPTEWQAGGLPSHVQAAANGRFELALPVVPADLQGTARLTAQISAVDPAGDRATGAVAVLLSQDGIQAQVVTELGDGLVESFNNRLYLRVTTPDGRVVANTRVTVKRAWQPGDRGLAAELDEDGVASLQLDPGAPVNIVIPAAPWRPAPKRALVSRGEVRDLISGSGASLADQVMLDRWLTLLAPCAVWVESSGQSTRIGVRVDPAGAVIAAGAGPSAVGRCATGVASRQRLSPGPERMYAFELAFVDPELPRLSASVDSALDVPAGLEARISELATAARDCLPSHDGPLASMLSWRARAGSKDVELTGWIADARAPDGRAALPCVTARFARGARIALDQPAPSDAIGVVRFAVAVPASATEHKPQPTTMLGYELAVTAGPAERGGQPSTRLRIPPGAVPDLRIRVTPVLAKPGDKLTAELIRGPKFTGKLPERVALDCLTQRTDAKLVDRSASFQLDDKTEGWCTISGGGVHALVYARPRAELTVTVVPARDRYAPGDKAELAIQTTLGGKGGQAAVGLFGVDDSLGQLVALPGGDALGRIRPRVETAAPAFGVLDGQALTLGRIRGANAAAATVLRVSSIPAPAALDAVVGGHAATPFDPIEELTDRFYIVLAELHAQAHRWEATAPPAEKMTPTTMARLWQAAIAACAARSERVTDAYGRTLRLSRLPPDLLALTDPRAVVVVATRLPEDVENWPAWVEKERP